MLSGKQLVAHLLSKRRVVVSFAGPKFGLTMLGLGEDCKPVSSDHEPARYLVCKGVREMLGARRSPAVAAGLTPMSHQLMSVAGHSVRGLSINQLHSLLGDTVRPALLAFEAWAPPERDSY